MIDLDAMRRTEIGFCARFADVARRDWGLLYHCRENAESHDSNHAVIVNVLAMDDTALGRALDEIEAFYRAYGVEPRVYSAMTPGEGRRLAPLLVARGYVCVPPELRFFEWRSAPRQAPNAALAVRRVTAIDDGLRALIHSDGPCPWTEGTITRQLPRDDYHLLVGCVGETPVTMASLAYDLGTTEAPGTGLARVDDVMTDPRHRGHGYARELLRVLVAYHAAQHADGLYLWAENPVAIRIYEESGFVALPIALDFGAAHLPARNAAAPTP